MTTVESKIHLPLQIATPCCIALLLTIILITRILLVLRDNETWKLSGAM